MLVQSLLFCVGLAMLYFGADWLVSGSSRLAIRYGIRPLVVGLTVVALATSMPEFVVNLIAAAQGQNDLALGNVVGSNIANIALILGATAVLQPILVAKSTLKREYPIMLLVMLVFFGMASNGVISRLEGIVLVLGLITLMVYLVLNARTAPPDEVNTNAPPLVEPIDVEPEAAERPVWQQVGLILIGMVLLAFGARLMVDAAVYAAELFGISPIVVGLTIVAIGTSLPELAASIMGIVRKEADLSLGNVLGSNMMNVLFVIGMIALIRPLPVETESIRLHFPVMIAVSVLLFPLARPKLRISRWAGVVLLIVFVAYTGYLIAPYL
ncbi:MAG: calcium/sodium antiporter [Rhodothermales bacterium]